MHDRTARWKDARESRDADRVLAFYAPDVTHASALVPQMCPELGGSIQAVRVLHL